MPICQTTTRSWWRQLPRDDVYCRLFLLHVSPQLHRDDVYCRLFLLHVHVVYNWPLWPRAWQLIQPAYHTYIYETTPCCSHLKLYLFPAWTKVLSPANLPMSVNHLLHVVNLHYRRRSGRCFLHCCCSHVNTSGGCRQHDRCVPPSSGLWMCVHSQHRYALLLVHAYKRSYTGLSYIDWCVPWLPITCTV